MLGALMALASLALVAPARACPQNCNCLQLADGRDGVECQLPSGSVNIKGTMQESVEVECVDNFTNIKCTELPEYPFSRNGSLTKLKVTDCALDGPLTCWLGRFGAKTIEMLVLYHVTTELRAEHVTGLGDVVSLLMYDAAVQKAIPMEALTALPKLKEVRIRGAHIPAPGPVNKLDSLVYLELSSGIEKLSESAFELPKLQKLHIWGNKISDLEEGNFKGLTSLKSLSIDRNRIRSLPSRVFSQMPHLTDFTFVANAVEEVAADAFYGLHELKTIKAFNNAAPMRLSPHALSNLPSLQQVTLDNCKIASLPPNLFVNSSNLHTLSLNRNQIESLPVDLFQDQHSLEKLDFSGNRIAELPDKLFLPLRNLIELNLDGNLIERLPGNLLTGLNRLTTLRINNNRLLHIAESAISHTPSLKNIYLSNNKLTLTSNTNPIQYSELPQSPFRMLLTLENLDLSGNNISQIFDDWRFVLYQNMKILNLSRNSITYLTDADTQFLSDNEETKIDLRHNKISHVILSNQMAFIQETTKTLQSTILLDKNPFVCDCRNQNFLLKLHNKFSYFNEIPKLDVGDAICAKPRQLKGKLLKDLDPLALTCPLEECPDSCTCEVKPSTKHVLITCNSLPKSLPDPVKYDMNGTELTLKSPPIILDLPEHVDSLILSGLHLQNLLPIPTSVRYVDLANNDLTDIPVDLLKRNVTLKLSGNPFACDCNHDEAVQILQYHKRNVLDHSLVRCSDKQSPWPIDAPRLCSVQRAALLGGSLAILSIILVILAGLYYRYSIEVKIFIYSCEKLRWLITEEDVDKDKKYDAFISFSHKDEKFVAEKLIPVLESGSRPFKLCVHYRDWVVGEWIPSQIVNSVEQSRRTIIVLSKSFVESVWGTMEFRVAHKRAQEEKRTRIVVVLLEDAPPVGDLDAELRAYLSTNTYVKWGDPWFWEKLKYALAGGRVGAKPKPEKTLKGGLNARLNSKGQLVNDTKDSTPIQLEIPLG